MKSMLCSVLLGVAMTGAPAKAADLVYPDAPGLFFGCLALEDPYAGDNYDFLEGACLRLAGDACEGRPIDESRGCLGGLASAIDVENVKLRESLPTKPTLRPFQSRHWDQTFQRLNSAESSDRLEERFSQVCSEIGRRKHGPVCDVLVSATSHFGWHALHRLANEATP